jgi:hypothetical protein
MGHLSHQTIGRAYERPADHPTVPAPELNHHLGHIIG